MLTQPVEYDLAELGLEIVRTMGAEHRVRCPFCPPAEDGKRREPAMAVNNDTGLWSCHRCGRSGNLYQLHQKLHGEPKVFHAARKAKPKAPAAKVFPAEHLAVMQANLFAPVGEKVLRYLTWDRGLTEDAVREHGLGYSKRGQADAVAIPFMRGGQCEGLKYRRLANDDPKYLREAGYHLPLFNVDSLDGEFKTVAITEGELDCVAWSIYETGIPAVSLPNGASQDLEDGHAAALEHFDEVLIVTDTDEAGEKAATKLAGRLGEFRCRRVRLPRKDANECLMDAVGREEVLAAIQAAKPYGDTAVQHISEWRELLLQDPGPECRGRPTGWHHLDEVLGGIRAGEVSALTAQTGQGKTTWTLDLARKQADRGNGVLIASLEIPTRTVARKLLSTVAGELWSDLEKPDRSAAVDRMCSLPLFLLNQYGELPVSKLRHEVSFAVRRHGVKLVVIDHLHFALGVRKPGEDERLLIDETAKAIQTLALQLQIHVVLVIHPGKIRTGQGGKARLPDIEDLKGSSGPAQFADNVLRISRVGDEPRAVLSVLKCRSELGKRGTVVFSFSPESLRFMDLFAKEIGA